VAQGLLDRLQAALQREGSLSGAELESAVGEKERLVAELEAALASGQVPEGDLAALAFANGLSLKLSRLKAQLALLGQKKPRSGDAAPRVDIIS
jgi:hypothetical protein